MSFTWDFFGMSGDTATAYAYAIGVVWVTTTKDDSGEVRLYLTFADSGIATWTKSGWVGWRYREGSCIWECTHLVLNQQGQQGVLTRTLSSILNRKTCEYDRLIAVDAFSRSRFSATVRSDSVLRGRRRMIQKANQSIMTIKNSRTQRSRSSSPPQIKFRPPLWGIFRSF